MPKISAVIVTWNEEKNIKRAIVSIKPFVDEVVVVDMSTDKEDQTAAIAKKLGARVFPHPYTGYVEPARNFAIGKSSFDWIFILDADEELPEALGDKLRSLASSNLSHYEIPRKNIIFGKWLQHTRYWPDYLIRFFKKDSLVWPAEIHVQPKASGQGLKLEPLENNAIIHNHYDSITQYLMRMDRYTDHQLPILGKNGYTFFWPDLIKKPVNEFLSRFYFGQGYLDGLHGFSVSCLQAFSEFVLYLKAWEAQKFKDQVDHNFKSQVEAEIHKSVLDWHHWVGKTSPFLTKLRQKFF